MATKTSSPRSSRHRSATVQWVALGVAGILAMLAAFIFFGDDSSGTGTHTGSAPISISTN